MAARVRFCSPGRCRVEAVVEPHLDEPSGLLARPRIRRSICAVPMPGGLLDEDVGTRASSARSAIGASWSWIVATTTTSGPSSSSSSSRAARPGRRTSRREHRAALGVDVEGADDLSLRRRAPAARLSPISPQPTIATRSGARVAHVYSVAYAPPNSKSKGSSVAPAAAIA